MNRAKRSWSLSRSLRRHVLVASTLPLLIAVSVGYSLLVAETERELRALVDEEVREAVLRLPGDGDVVQHFAEIADQCQSEHPGFPMAWRVVDTTSNGVLAGFGEAGLWSRIDTLPLPADGIVGFGNLLGGKAASLPDDRLLIVLIDGAVLRGSVQDFVLASALLVVLGVVLALVAGSVVAGRIRRLFGDVAERVAAAPAGDVPLHISSGNGAHFPDEIREVAERLQLMLQQIRAASEESRVFTMSLAHELRSPVQNLIGQSEVALMKSRDSAAYEHTLTAHLSELVQFSDALDNLLTYCAQPHARTEQHESFDLVEEAKIRLLREQQRGQRKQVIVSVASHGDTRMIGDREAVMRGVRNVVANAVDWTPAGRGVSVEIYGDDAGVHVVVEDGGPGLPVELREKVFEPFFQGPSAQRGRIGYGLGLAMTRKVADSHGGRVAVGDAGTGGARFVIDFARDTG